LGELPYKSDDEIDGNFKKNPKKVVEYHFMGIA